MLIQKGLKDVVAVETKIASVDGNLGELRYRGRRVDELVGHSFEEVAAYIWTGQVNQIDLQSYRKLPEHVEQVIDLLPVDVTIMDALRTAVSAFSHKSFIELTIGEQAKMLTAVLPVVVARHYRKQMGRPVVDSDPSLSHTANYLWMLTGELPTEAQIEALETYLLLTMEHGLNASTFAARVTISTESDLTSAVTSALGTMKGPLHGGAPSGVIDLLEEIRAAGEVKAVIEKKMAEGERIMGFGHRVYKTEDPRSILLREKCLRLNGKDEWLDLATRAEREIIDLLAIHKPGRKLYTNVEFYAAAIMRSIQMPPELFTPTFSVARVVGWTAHAMEQLSDNTIFRPQSIYVGNML